MTSAVRKPLGGILIVAALGVYAWLVGAISSAIGGLPGWLQAVVYLVLGLAWVPLFFPLVRWIETGRARKPRPAARAGDA